MGIAGRENRPRATLSRTRALPLPSCFGARVLSCFCAPLLHLGSAIPMENPYCSCKRTRFSLPIPVESPYCSCRLTRHLVRSRLGRAEGMTRAGTRTVASRVIARTRQHHGTHVDRGLLCPRLNVPRILQWPTAALPMENPCCSCNLTRKAPAAMPFKYMDLRNKCLRAKLAVTPEQVHRWRCVQLCIRGSPSGRQL